MARTTELKDDVIAAGVNLLNIRGFAALTISEVAKELGISKQSVYYHYPGADELVLLIAKKWSESGQRMTIEALARSEETGIYRVKAMAEGMFDWVNVDPDLAKLALTLYQLSPHIKKLNTFMSTAREAGRNRIKSLLLVDERFKRAKPRYMEEITTALHSHMYGSFFYLVAMNELKNVETIRTNCLEGLDRLLDAYSAEL